MNPLDLAWLIPVLPFGSALLMLFVGKRTPGKGAPIGILALAIAWVLSVMVFLETIGRIAAEEHFEAIERSVRWFVFGPQGFQVELGMTIDGLAAVMLVVVSTVSLLVHVYSTGYMKGDIRYTWFFVVLSLFTGSMLNLVVANNLLQMLVGWEGVGICSYLLIGHWWEERANSSAAIKAFLTTRVGDIGFMFGIFVLFFAAGSFNIGVISSRVAAGAIPAGVITLGALLLFCGAIGKSAQFPLHVWLPDAMAGPTPVSALIHAATMVVAGVYLVARMFQVFAASPVALTVVAAIGSITMLIAALLALVQDDLKRVLAYSTISQLAYMVAGLGVSAYTGSIFHIWTHAWFKALLFLAAGSVIHAVHSNNMSSMGGLRRLMPVTSATFIVGALALAAFPPLAGFFSKDELVLGAYTAATHGSQFAWFVFAAMVATAFLTACYVARMLALTFFGEPKYDREHVHPHESPRSMTVPLVILAVLAVVGGWVGLPGEANLFGRWVHFGEEEHAPVDFGVMAVSVALSVSGFAVGWAIFRLGKARVDVLRSPFAWAYRLLQNKYYLDDVYTKGIVNPIRDRLSAFAYWTNQNIIDKIVDGAGLATRGLATVAYRDVDQTLIDGTVNGAAGMAGAIGNKLRFWQTGSVQRYAVALFISIVAFVGAFAVARL
ncbi:MAG: NADH-quinone oxidoreductase subunit L [Actinomycetota bacterium]|nr:NADH-quinone oxidoreductase subunit L [Actinomycetota bacterium]